MAGAQGREYWWVAPIYAQAGIAYRRLKRMLPLGLYTCNETEMTVTLANGAVLRFRGADKPDSLYGEDVWAAVVDEASRCKEEAWHAVRSTLTATRGPVRIIGNVKGRKNWAYRMARQAQAGEPGMHYAKITALDAVKAGITREEEVEDARRTLPESVFNELYMAEPSEDGQNPFGIAAIRRCISPLASGDPVAWGWDLAKSVDWTCGVGLAADGHAVRALRFQQPWEETVGTILHSVGSVPALVDSTGAGDPILERLQRTRGNSVFEGFVFSGRSKQQLMEGLAVAIHQQEICYPQEVADELENYEYVYTRTGVQYAAPDGYHDDWVCALALSVQKWNQIRRYRPMAGPLERPTARGRKNARIMVRR